jgi:glutathione S-transferase
LEELHAPYTLRALNMKAGEHRRSDYLAVNPVGKVPAVLHGETSITEQLAIGIYLADLFPEARMSPLVFVGSSLLDLQKDSEAGDVSDTQGKHFYARARSA